MKSTLLDTGPIVGLLWQRDAHHRATVGALQAAARQGRVLSTTWEAIAEAYTLLRMRIAPAQDAGPALEVLRWARESGIRVAVSRDEDRLRAGSILERYREHRLSFVDAVQLALAERERIEELITVDGAHFGLVRLGYQPVITVV